MKITAFFPSPSERENFADILARDLVNEEGEFTIVNVHYQRLGQHDELSDCVGLDIALTLNPEESPIILCGFLPESYFILRDEFSHKFHALMAQKRITYLDLSQGSTTDVWVKKYHELLEDNKVEDLLAIEINQVVTFNEKMGHIQHRFQSYFGDNSDFAKKQISNAVKEARGIGAIGNDEEIALQIKNFERKPGKAIFAGRYFQGVFCDLENTLLINDEVNEKMLKKLKELSTEKPITLWTAGDVKEYQKKLISKGILWKLVSKIDFFGAEVEIAYDDYSYEKFQGEYGINVREFNQVIANEKKELELRLEFLHSILTPGGIPDVLTDDKLFFILHMSIKSKKILAYLEEMQDIEDMKDYNKMLAVIRDYLIS